MIDILLRSDGDLLVTEQGDIVIGDSVSQKIKIRLKWFEGEWRWNKEEGLPYLESLMIKNPDTDLFEAAVREKIFEVEEVTEVKNVSVTFDAKERVAEISFVAYTDEEVIKEEVRLVWQNTE